MAPLLRRTDAIPLRTATVIDRPRGFFSQVPTVLDGAGAYVGLRKGRLLFTEGQPSFCVFAIHSGMVKLTKTSREGKTLLVRLARPGDLLGFSAALSQQPYEVTATAMEDTMVRSYAKMVFLNIIHRTPEASTYAVASLSNDYRSALSGVCLLARSSSISGKVAYFLLEIALRTETIRTLRPEIHVPLTHEELASMLGTTRETVTRTLNKLKRNGILAIAGRKVTILNREALEAMA
jgi:CRP/FNR family transcriptional regulator